ncbi:hypothetical protein BJ166DRAFT_523898 [Pestalotiopsis sp. NC0098]|nr:hypothetical protein BJ166DRAFT_523898 [Pestalotiopsis sp. NC0098]
MHRRLFLLLEDVRENTLDAMRGAVFFAWPGWFTKRGGWARIGILAPAALPIAMPSYCFLVVFFPCLSFIFYFLLVGNVFEVALIDVCRVVVIYIFF